MKSILACILGILIVTAAKASVEVQEVDAQKTAWYTNAKFGMFIHWGPYSLASVEASWPIMRPDWYKGPYISLEDYLALPSRFNPVRFDPRHWVKLAKAAGQKYMVFTTKHHDGFAMFDAENMNDYKVTRTPYGKDIFGELAQAAKEEGMPLGIYYSPPDLHHAGYRDTSKDPATNYNGEPARAAWPSYLDYMDAQLRQLLTRYGNIVLVWFDGFVPYEKYNGARFHNLIHQLQPQALINNRIGPAGDFTTPEQFIPAQPPAGPWETCMTINNTWAYNKNDHAFKSTATLLRNLVDIVSKGGNFLLNVGPDPTGVIQPEFEERLLQMGAWLAKNGEAIYGTVAGPVLAQKDVRLTAKGSRLYVHMLAFPASGKLHLAGLRASVQKVSLLSTGQPLKYAQTAAGLDVELPASAAGLVIPVLALDRRLP